MAGLILHSPATIFRGSAFSPQFPYNNVGFLTSSRGNAHEIVSFSVSAVLTCGPFDSGLAVESQDTATAVYGKPLRGRIGMPGMRCPKYWGVPDAFFYRKQFWVFVKAASSRFLVQCCSLYSMIFVEVTCQQTFSLSNAD